MFNLIGIKFLGEVNILFISILIDVGERFFLLGVLYRFFMFIIVCNVLFFFRNLLVGGWMYFGDCLLFVLLEILFINFCFFSFVFVFINLIFLNSFLGGLYLFFLLVLMGRIFLFGGC